MGTYLAVQENCLTVPAGLCTILGMRQRCLRSFAFKTMAIINHTVEQLITEDAYTAFRGLDRLKFRVVLPEWHKPFPVNGTREWDGFALYHVCRAWYINGPVMDQYTISTGLGPLKVPAGTRIVSEELPEKWEANREEASQGKKQWWAYTNGRNDFC